MPDVLNLKSQDWELNVWVKDNSDRLQVLQKTMAARDRILPQSSIYLSPPVAAVVLRPEIHQAEAGALASELHLPTPVFFENKQYEFEFLFDEKFEFSNEPKIVHRLAAIEDGFHFSKKSRSLRGSINFANDVGWFRLGLRYTAAALGTAAAKEQSQTISFEVLPTKMAMDTDLAAIHKAIDAAYPLWRFSFAQKTEQELARSHQKHERFALLWLAHFKQLRSKLEDAVKLVIRAPHARLQPRQRAVRLERLRGRLTPRLEAQVHEHLLHGEDHHRYQITSRHLSVDTPENRFVKMVVKRCSAELSTITKLALRNQKVPEEGGKLSASFFTELASWKTPLDQLINQPFFAEVGQYDGMEHESLVLHQRAGYANVYRLWQELKMYLGVFGQHAAVSMKSVADLYEVWCFLQMKKMLEDLGFTELSSAKASLRNAGLEKSMVNGTTSAFQLYRKSDNLHLRLSHEPNFSQHQEHAVGKIYSWTTKQVPDIFLEATFKNGKVARWIFDAKYRIWDDNDTDMAPDDAINQMHRYRDALIHIDKTGDGWKEKSRPVLGAFVLYPGWFDEANALNPYAKSIEDVGIGAFPLLPDHSNLWLRQFLENQFGNEKSSTPYVRPEADRYLVEDSARIPVTGTYLGVYRDLTLVANLGHLEERTKEYAEKYFKGSATWYHIPVSTTVKKSISNHVMKETRYCAIAVAVPGNIRHISYLYEVLNIEIVARNTLTLEQTGKVETDSEKKYWLLTLGPSVKIDQPFAFADGSHFMIFHTSASGIKDAKVLEDLPRYYQELVY